MFCNTNNNGYISATYLYIDIPSTSEYNFQSALCYTFVALHGFYGVTINPYLLVSSAWCRQTTCQSCVNRSRGTCSVHMMLSLALKHNVRIWLSSICVQYVNVYVVSKVLIMYKNIVQDADKIKVRPSDLGLQIWIIMCRV